MDPNLPIMAHRRWMRPPVKVRTIDRAPQSRSSMLAADQGIKDGHLREVRQVREHATADGGCGTVQP